MICRLVALIASTHATERRDVEIPAAAASPKNRTAAAMSAVVILPQTASSSATERPIKSQPSIHTPGFAQRRGEAAKLAGFDKV
jgi:hypothetical protein